MKRILPYFILMCSYFISYNLFFTENIVRLSCFFSENISKQSIGNILSHSITSIPLVIKNSLAFDGFYVDIESKNFIVNKGQEINEDVLIFVGGMSENILSCKNLSSTIVVEQKEREIIVLNFLKNEFYKIPLGNKL